MLGDIHLQALGIDLNVQASLPNISVVIVFNCFSQNELGQTLLHLAVVNGKVNNIFNWI